LKIPLLIKTLLKVCYTEKFQCHLGSNMIKGSNTALFYQVEGAFVYVMSIRPPILEFAIVLNARQPIMENSGPYFFIGVGPL
jgi:hypothetical protein